MKCNLLLVTLLISSIGLSQFGPAYTCVTNKSNSQNRCPIHRHTSYVAILNGNISKDNLIEVTKNLLEDEGYSTEDDVYTYDDDLKSIKLMLQAKGGMYLGNIGYGMKTVQTPVMLFYDCILTFNEENQVMIEFTNFDSKSLVVLDDENNFVDIGKLEKLSPVLHKKYTSFGSDTSPKKDTKTSNSGSLFKLKVNLGKKGIETETENNFKEELGISDMFQKRAKFRENVNEEFHVYEQEVKNNPNVYWIMDSELANYNKKYKQANALIQSAINNGEIIGVTKGRFTEYYQPIFNYFIKYLAQNISAEVDEVGMNGIVIYKNYNGTVLPVDKKLQKKWKRKGITF